MNKYLIIALAWVTSLVAVGAWQNSAGHVAERSDWQGREAKELTAANAAIKSLEEAARATERSHSAELATIATNYESKLSDATKQRSADLAAIRAGTLKLRDPATSIRSCGDPMPGIATSPGVGDGRAAGELSQRASEFLVGEASRADSVAEQLAACQQVVRGDRAP